MQTLHVTADLTEVHDVEAPFFHTSGNDFSQMLANTLHILTDKHILLYADIVTTNAKNTLVTGGRHCEKELAKAAGHVISHVRLLLLKSNVI